MRNVAADDAATTRFNGDNNKRAVVRAAQLAGQARLTVASLPSLPPPSPLPNPPPPVTHPHAWNNASKPAFAAISEPAAAESWPVAATAPESAAAEPISAEPAKCTAAEATWNVWNGASEPAFTVTSEPAA